MNSSVGFRIKSNASLPLVDKGANLSGKKNVEMAPTNENWYDEDISPFLLDGGEGDTGKSASQSDSSDELNPPSESDVIEELDQDFEDSIDEQAQDMLPDADEPAVLELEEDSIDEQAQDMLPDADEPAVLELEEDSIDEQAQDMLPDADEPAVLELEEDSIDEQVQDMPSTDELLKASNDSSSTVDIQSTFDNAPDSKIGNDESLLDVGGKDISHTSNYNSVEIANDSNSGIEDAPALYDLDSEEDFTSEDNFSEFLSLETEGDEDGELSFDTLIEISEIDDDSNEISSSIDDALELANDDDLLLGDISEEIDNSNNGNSIDLLNTPIGEMPLFDDDLSYSTRSILSEADDIMKDDDLSLTPANDAVNEKSLDEKNREADKQRKDEDVALLSEEIEDKDDRNAMSILLPTDEADIEISELEQEIGVVSVDNDSDDDTASESNDSLIKSELDRETVLSGEDVILDSEDLQSSKEVVSASNDDVDSVAEELLVEETSDIDSEAEDISIFLSNEGDDDDAAIAVPDREIEATAPIPVEGDETGVETTESLLDKSSDENNVEITQVDNTTEAEIPNIDESVAEDIDKTPNLDGESYDDGTKEGDGDRVFVNSGEIAELAKSLKHDSLLAGSHDSHEETQDSESSIKESIQRELSSIRDELHALRESLGNIRKQQTPSDEEPSGTVAQDSSKGDLPSEAFDDDTIALMPNELDNILMGSGKSGQEEMENGLIGIAPIVSRHAEIS